MTSESVLAIGAISPETEEILQLDSVDHILCEFGDLLVLLTKDDTTTSFLVSRLSLRMAASFFDKALDPETRFAKLTENVRFQARKIPVLRLHDDHCDSLLWILCIAHLKHELLPKEISFDDLRELAITCKKYDVVKTILYMTSSWARTWGKKALNDGMEDWLFIGPALGENSGLKQLEERLVKNIGVRRSSDGCEFWIQGRLLDVKLIPDNVIEDILAQRIQFIRRVTLVLYIAERALSRASPANTGSAYRQVSVIDPEVTRFQGILNHKATCSEDCLSMAYGSLVRSIQRLRLDKYVWNVGRENFDDWEGNIVDLIEGLEQPIVRIPPPVHHSNYNRYGSPCGLTSFEKDMRMTMNPWNFSHNMPLDLWERIWGECRAQGLVEECKERPRYAQDSGNGFKTIGNMAS